MAKKRFEPLKPEAEENLPSPIFQLLQAYRADTQPFRKVHRLVDLLEWAIKWHTVVAVADLLQQQELPERVKLMFAEGLRTPSLGIWMLFYREAVQALDKPRLPYREWDRLEQLEKRHNLIAFRNAYAHGATPPDEACAKDCDRIEPLVLQLLGSAIFGEVGLAAARRDGIHVLRGENREACDMPLRPGRAGALLQDGTILDLWPLIQVAPATPKEDGDRVFFFNAIKNKTIERLNYELPLLQRDRDVHDPFQEVFPLSEWKRTEDPSLGRFREQVVQLTENFEGRADDRARIADFFLEGTGTLLLTGPPGIGKSALVASAVAESRGREDGAEAAPQVLEYFVRSSLRTDSPVEFLKHLCRGLDSRYGLTGLPLGPTEPELAEALEQRLGLLDQQARETDIPQMALIIDGLDESPSMLRYVPEPRSWLKVLFASRPVTDVMDWWRRWCVGRSSREEIDLRPLGRVTTTDGTTVDEVRAILLRVVDKYQDGFDEAFLNEVHRRSQGNPLYLTLLCEMVMASSGTVPDIDAIPQDLADLYAVTVKRLSQNATDRDVLSVLYLLAEAKASLTVPAIAELLGMESLRAQAAVDRVRELLMEDPSTPDVEDFQLFHESLREWLRQHAAAECETARRSLAELCAGWRDRGEARQYALEFAAAHLDTAGESRRLFEIVVDDGYRKAQLGTFRHYGPTLRSAKTALDHFIARDGATPADDGRLAAVALLCGQIGHNARADIRPAFEWVEKRPLDDPDRMADALARLEVLNDGDFFMAAILLLWIEADRRRGESCVDAVPEEIDLVLDAVDKRVPEGPGTVDWATTLDPAFMSFWIRTVLSSFPLERDSRLLRIITHSNRWNATEALLQILREDRGATEPDTAAVRIAQVLGTVAESVLSKLNFKDLVGTISFDLPKFASRIEVASALARYGLKNEAGWTFSRFLDVVEEIHDPDDKLASLASIASEIAKANGIQNRGLLLQRIYDETLGTLSGNNGEWVVDPDPGYAGDVASALDQCNEPEKAREIWARATYAAAQTRWKVLSFAKAIVSARNVADREELFSQMLNTIASEDFSYYGEEIINCLIEVSSPEDIVRLASRMFEFARGIEDSRTRIGIITQLVPVIGNAPESAERYGLFDAILEDSRGQIDPEDRSALLAHTAAALALAGENEKAKRVWEEACAARLTSVEFPSLPISVLCALHKVIAQTDAADRLREAILKEMNGKWEEGFRDWDADDLTEFEFVVEAIAAAPHLPDRELFLAKTFEKMKSMVDDNPECRAALLRMATSLLKAEDYGDRESVVVQLLESALASGESSMNQLTKGDITGFLEAVIRSRGLRDRMDLLHKIFLLATEFFGYNADEDFFQAALLTVVRSGDSAERFKLCSSVLAIIESFDRFSRKGDALLGFARAIAEAENLDGRTQLFRNVICLAISLGNEFPYNAGNILAGVIVAVGHGLGAIKNNSDRSTLFDECVAASANLRTAEQKRSAMFALAAGLGTVDDTTLGWEAFAKGLELRDTIPPRQITDNACRQVAPALARSGRLQRGFAVAEDVHDRWRAAQAVQGIAEILLKTGDQGEVRPWFTSIADFYLGLDDVVAEEGIRGLSFLTAEATQHLNRLDLPYLSKKTLDAVSQIEDRRGATSAWRVIRPLLSADWEAPEQTAVFNRALEVIKKMGEDSFTRSEAIGELAEAACWTEALANRAAVLDDICVETMKKSDSYTESAIRHILSALGRGVDFPERSDLFSRFLAYAQKLPEGADQSSAFGDLAEALASAGEISESTRALDMIHPGAKNNRIRAHCAIAIALAETGELKPAEEHFAAARSIAEEDHSPFSSQSDHLVVIAKALARSGMFDRALQTTDRIEDDHEKAAAITGMAAALSEKREIQDVRKVFSALIESLAGLEDSWRKTESTVAIADSLALMKEKVGRSELFADLLTQAVVMRNDEQKSSSLAGIISKMVSAGLQEQAAGVLCHTTLSDYVLERCVPQWQSNLVELDPPPMTLIRESLGYCPYSQENSFFGVSSLIAAQIAAQNLPHAEDIVRECPQLGLGSLLLEITEASRTYATLDDWLDDIDDEDTQAKIALWARKVASGKMDESEFNQAVAEAFPDHPN